MTRTVDFAGTILLDTSIENLFQPIYSSQSYGTYYSIFAKIQSTKLQSNQGAILDHITFKIINYSGLIDISLISVKPSFIDTNDNSKKVLVCDISMMGATTISAKKEVILDFEAIELDGSGNPILDPNNNPIPIHPDYFDPQNRIVNSGDMVEVTRNLLSLTGVENHKIPEYNPNASHHESGGVFDTEYFKRAGEGRGAIKKKAETNLDSLSLVQRLNGEELPVDGGQDGGTGELCFSGAAYFLIP